MTQKIQKTIDDFLNFDSHEAELYRSLFLNSVTVMLIINPENGEIIDANFAACNYYQYPHEQLIKMKISHINILEKRKIYEEMQSAKTENRNYFLFQHKLANGEIRDVEVYSSPITIADKKLLYSIIHDVTERNAIERDREKLITELKEAFSKIRILKGLIPICASCKSIRDDEGYWNDIEKYIANHSDIEFSHSICPMCAKKLYPEYYKGK